VKLEVEGRERERGSWRGGSKLVTSCLWECCKFP